MQIAVACKVVPDDQNILINPDGSLDYSKAYPTVSTYDLNAIEAAAQFAEAVDGRVIALSVGTTQVDNSKVKKSILSRGVEELFILADDSFEGAEAYSTAQALRALIVHAGGADVIICGDGSADNYAQQVDVQLAEAMGVPCVVGVTALKKENDVLVVTRVVESRAETIEVPLPAVISVSPDIALPRICGMKEILAAGKKPSTVLTTTELAVENISTVAVDSAYAPQTQTRRLEIYDSSVDGDVGKFVSALREALR